MAGVNRAESQASVGRSRASAVIQYFEKIVPALVVLVTFTWALRRLDNSDTWWHLAAGRWIAEHRTVPYVDTLSSTVSDHRWINLQWLYEVVLYVLYTLGGASSVVVATAVGYSLVTILLLKNLRLTLDPLSGSAIGFWAVIVAQERFAIRPEVVSFLLLEAVLWLCATGLRATDRRLWLLPPILLLWANCHALFVIGLFVVGCAMASSVASAWRLLPASWGQPLEPAEMKRMLIAGTGAFLATVINPYGFNGVIHPIRLMSRINGNNPAFHTIGEFKPPFSGYFVTFAITAYQLFFVFSIVVLVFAVAQSFVGGTRSKPSTRSERRVAKRRDPSRAVSVSEDRAETTKTRIDAAGLISLIGFAYLSLLARRNIAVFALGAAPFVGRCLAAIYEGAPDALRRYVQVARLPLAAAMTVMLLATNWFIVTNGFYRWSGDLHEFGMGVQPVGCPIRASAFAREMKLPAPFFNDLTTGGYLTWDRPIPGGVYMDGRLEVYESEFFSAYLRLLADPQRWQAEADRIGIQTVFFFHWWPNHQALVRWLVNSRQWALVYFDEATLIFVRRDGNDEIIEKSIAAFAPIREERERELLAPVPSWQWPVARVRALGQYADALIRVGKGDRAPIFRVKLRELSGS